jgi:DNA topoisomerase-1
MRQVLVIAEKSLAAQRIAYLLAEGKPKSRSGARVRLFTFEKGDSQYTVMGLRGHIVELDYPGKYSNWEGVKPEELIWVQPKASPLAKDVIATLKMLTKEMNAVIIATDYDREGELIGVEAIDIIKDAKPGLEFSRAKFSALIRSEVESGFADLKKVDYNLADAARARQTIDLAWGAVLTRMVSLIASQRGRNFLSVGRVQTPTLALIVNREREITSFVPKPFWLIRGRFSSGGREFEGEHAEGQIWEEKRAKEIHEHCKDAKKATVIEHEVVEHQMRAPYPFDTTTFLAELGKLGISSYRGMALAEELYMKGYISYPRTDNTVYPRGLGLRAILDELERSDLKEDATKLKAITDYRPTRGPRETTDHPPIHPTQGAKCSDMSPEQWRIYELVARRFMATIAPSAIIKATHAKLDVMGEPFAAHGNVVVSKGWLEFYPYTRIDEKKVPEMRAGDVIDVMAITMKADRTKPPARYSESKLLREMASYNLGTKSTRHEIIQKLHERKFIEGRTSIRPTPHAVAMISALERHANVITTHEMTAQLESEMDMIADGSRNLDGVVEDSRSLLQKASETIRSHEQSIQKELTAAIQEYSILGQCKCGGDLRIVSYKDSRFAGCSNYPECKVTHPLPANTIVRAAGTTCERCGFPEISIQNYPHAKPRVECIDYNCHMSEQDDLGRCPKCKKGRLREKRSHRGKRFVACSNYPKCTNTYPLPQFGKIRLVKSECALCGAPIVMTYTKRGPWSFCLNMQCPSKKKEQYGDTKPEKRKGS